MTTKDIRDDDLPPYGKGNRTAGFRDDDASRDGARKVNRDGTCKTQCAFALSVVEAAGPEGISSYGVYEADDAPFRDLSTCRARLSNLKTEGKIVKKGERTPGEAGVAVNLWIAARYAPPKEDERAPDLFAASEPIPSPRATLSIRKNRPLEGLLARYVGKAA